MSDDTFILSRKGEPDGQTVELSRDDLIVIAALLTFQEGAENFELHRKITVMADHHGKAE